MSFKEDQEKKSLFNPIVLQPKLLTKGKFSKTNVKNSCERYLIDREWIYKANPIYKEKLESNEKLDRMLLEKLKLRTIRE